MIAALALVLANAQTAKANPPLSAMRQVRGVALQKLVASSRVEYGIPGALELELFWKSGRYELFRNVWVEKGRWSIKGDLICTMTPNELCKKLYRDKRGRYYYVSATDELQRPWRITFTPNVTLPSRPLERKGSIIPDADRPDPPYNASTS